jgi:hypothetical protein
MIDWKGTTTPPHVTPLIWCLILICGSISPAQLLSWVFFMLPAELSLDGFRRKIECISNNTAAVRLLFEVFSRIIINYDLDYKMECVYMYVEVADSEANTYAAREN